MDRGVPLFITGVVIVVAEWCCMFLTSDPETLRAWGLRGLGFGTPLGVALCVASGPLGRHRKDAA